MAYLKYRVVRKELPYNPDTLLPYEGVEESSHIVWEGTDPADYKGGLGAYDTGESFVTRQMEGLTPSGEWEELNWIK